MATPWRFIGNFNYTQFSADALVFDLAAYAIGARRQLEGVMIVPTAGFVNPGATFYSVAVGVAAITDLYLGAYDMLGAVPGPTTKQVGASDDVQSLAGWSIVMRAESDAGLDLATAGAFDFFVKLVTIPEGT